MPGYNISKNGWLKRILICTFITIYLTVTSMPPRANANPVAVAAGAVEIGTLAFWGGAVLVASVGTAVGMDDDLAQDIKDFGKAAWTGANDAIKASISWSVSAMSWGSSTAETKTTYAVQFTPEVKTYLESSFKSHFIDNPLKPLTVDPVTGLIVTAASLTTYQSMRVRSFDYALGFISPYYYVREITYNAAEKAWVIRSSTSITSTSLNGTWPHYGLPYTDAASAYKYFVDAGIIDIPKWDNWPLDKTPEYGVPTTPDVITPAIPVGMPDVFTMPAPTGTVDDAGKVIDYAFPAIGYPDAVRPANPASPWDDIAIGNPAIPANPAIPGQRVKDLTKTDTITATPDIAVPTTGNPAIPANPPLDWSDTPTDGLNFGPLRIAGDLFTTKFPFSIPWDIQRQFNVFNVNPKPPVLHVDKSIPIFNTSMKLKFDIDFTIMEPAAVVVRWFMIIAFDLGMILAMRKFMPE